MKRSTLAATLLILAAGVSWPVMAIDIFGGIFGSEKTVLEPLRGVPYQPSKQAIGVERDLINQRASGYGLVSSDSLETYANGVLDKLKAATGIPGLPGKVYLLATDDLAAVTTPDGNIYIGYRWFENLNQPRYKLGQEDTLAAMLAHELGHTALGHHNSDWVANVSKWVQRYYAQAMALKVSLEQKFNATATAPLPPQAMLNLQKMQYMVEVMDGMLHPAWKRGQEEDADAFAVDVTMAASVSSWPSL